MHHTPTFVDYETHYYGRWTPRPHPAAHSTQRDVYHQQANAIRYHQSTGSCERCESPMPSAPLLASSGPHSGGVRWDQNSALAAEAERMHALLYGLDDHSIATLHAMFVDGTCGAAPSVEDRRGSSVASSVQVVTEPFRQLPADMFSPPQPLPQLVSACIVPDDAPSSFPSAKAHRGVVSHAPGSVVAEADAQASISPRVSSREVSDAPLSEMEARARSAIATHEFQGRLALVQFEMGQRFLTSRLAEDHCALYK